MARAKKRKMDSLQPGPTGDAGHLAQTVARLHGSRDEIALAARRARDFALEQQAVHILGRKLGRTIRGDARARDQKVEPKQAQS